MFRAFWPLQEDHKIKLEGSEEFSVILVIMNEIIVVRLNVNEKKKLNNSKTTRKSKIKM